MQTELRLVKLFFIIQAIRMKTVAHKVRLPIAEELIQLAVTMDQFLTIAIKEIIRKRK